MNNVHVFQDKKNLGKEAAQAGAKLINDTIAQKGYATIILATGASQFEMLEALITMDIDWSVVEVFHLDEYIGLPISHPASFRKYLKERFADKVKNLKQFNYINTDNLPIEKELSRLENLITAKQIDVAFIGVGENGHLAFNDPPADYNYDKPYLVVDLDKACRQQQLNEGWFKTLEDVPKQAVSMSVKQIMKSTHIINSIPDERKAQAVAKTLTGPVTNMCPASILQQHPSCHWYLDVHSAGLLPQEYKKA